MMKEGWMQSWFVFGFVMLYIFATISVSGFMVYMFNNEDIIFPVLAIMLILGIILFTISIKRWLNEKSNVIINMTDTKEGKKERTKLLLKKCLISFMDFNLTMIVLNLPTRATGIDLFIKDIIGTLIFSIIFVGIIGFFEYKKIQKRVKEFNEKD